MMKKVSEDYYNIVREELQEFVFKYQNNPFDFLTEYDIQSYLYTKIFDHFSDEEILVKIETNGENEPIRRWRQNKSSIISINPVKTEYPAGYRFDIAVIDEQTIETKPSAYWHQKLKIAIEIKFHRCSFHRIPAEIRKFESDILKLRGYVDSEQPTNFRGLSILFIQNDNDEREKEFTNRFTDGYILSDLNNIMLKSGVEGIIVTGRKCYLKDKMNTDSLKQKIKDKNVLQI